MSRFDPLYRAREPDLANLQDEIARPKTVLPTDAQILRAFSIGTLAELRKTRGSIDGNAGPRVCMLAGHLTALDAGAGLFVWDATSTAADDATTTPNANAVTAVYGVDPGRWRRLSTGGGGGTGPQGITGPPGFAVDGEDGQDGMPMPGPQGSAGGVGATGPQGLTGPPGFGQDADEPEPPWLVPGRAGTNGTNGSQGIQGPPGFGQDADEPEAPMMIPGPAGPAGASGGGGGLTAVTPVTIDFGTAPGSSEASVVVVGQAGVAAGSTAWAWIMGSDTSSDHTASDHRYAAAMIAFTCGSISAGVGYTIFARCLLGKMQGTFTVRSVWF